MKLLLTLSVLCPLLAGLAACAAEAPFLKPTWDASRLREEFKGRTSAMMLAYWLMDRNHREGKGNSDRQSSGDLAWGESPCLMDYVMCYRAFEDSYWLDKIVDHFDRMIGNLSDPEGDGFLSWRDRKYSVGIVSLTSSRNTEGLTLDPVTSRLSVVRPGDQVTGHKYSLAFTTPNTLEVRDETEKKLLATKEYKDKIVLTDIPGAQFTIAGAASAGARFDFDSTPGEEIEYQVHDGMITYPIAQFIEIVYNDPRLHAKHKKKADEYLAFIDKHIRQKWESTWVELPDNAGAYVFTSHKTQRFAGGLLPHNQYLALARTYIVLKDVEGVPSRRVYLEKAEKMARYFKNSLRLQDDAYVWNYWDPYPPIPDVKLRIEDTGHGSIDTGFAAEACNRNVVFTPEDLRRFSNTYTEVMWNKSPDDPKIAGLVDGRSTRKDGRVIREYAKLAQWNPKVWDIVMLMQKNDGGAGVVPSILYMVAGMTGMDAEEARRFHAMRSELEKGFVAGRHINGDFELGGSPALPPLGWSFGVWSQCKGRGVWVEGGRDSKRAILLEGAEGEVNIVAYPVIRTKVKKPTLFKMSVFYRTEGEAKPSFSFIGHGADASRPKQYDNSPPLEKSADWKKAEWAITSAEGMGEVYFILRNHGAGKVFYDDFHMEKVEE